MFPKIPPEASCECCCWKQCCFCKSCVTRHETQGIILLVEVINEIKREIRLYAKDSECLLKQKTPEDIRKFCNESFYKQLFEKYPKLAILIGLVSKPGNLKGKLPPLGDETNNHFRNAVCMATAICLHQYNQQINEFCPLQDQISLLLLNGGA